MDVRGAVLPRLLRTLVRNASRGLTPEARFSLLASLGSVLVPEYRFKWPQMEWWHDDAFTRYLARFGEAAGFNADRRLMVHELIRLTEGVPGDTAECGVYQGAGSYVICAANAKDPDRSHHIFDSFAGLSEPSDQDGEHWTAGNLAFGLAGVRENLSEFERVHYYQGWIPERFPEVSDRRFSFVHIDVDLAEPTRDSIEFFYPLMNPGGIIVCDDYGFTTCPGATRAIDDFLAGRDEKMIRLSGGGGFMVKGSRTGAPPLSSWAKTAGRGVGRA